MFDQLDLELILKSCKKWKKYLIFMNFVVKDFIVKNEPPQKCLMFKYYNLVDPMELGATTF
jgi:hypothetical protein